MSPLNAKLARDLWRVRAQSAAIMVVIAIGVALQIMMSGFFVSLTQTRSAYYERHQLAQIFASVVRAPDTVTQKLADIPGVRKVESRVVGTASINIENRQFPIAAQVISLPLKQERHLNEVHLKSGRMPNADRHDEIVLLDSFAQAHRISAGMPLEVTLNGKRRQFKVVGTAVSPEFVYFAAPGELIPDDARFGVLWMGRKTAAAALDLQGAFNQALFLLSRDARQQAVFDQIDRVLDPYGTSGAFALADLPSDRFLTEEISGIGVTSKTVPPVFLLVSAFLLYIVTSRMIQSEREEIGLLKAFGYTTSEIARHYLLFAVLIAICGAFLGCALGVILGRATIPVYTTYYKLPFLLFRLEPSTFVSGMAMSVGVASAGGLLALRKIVGKTPAEAMRPPKPPDFSRGFSFKGRVMQMLDQPTRMVLRRLLRQPWRALGAALGIGTGMALSLAMLIIYDGFDTAIEQTFQVVDRSDASVSFVGNADPRALYELQRIPGVAVVEPVRHVATVFRNGLYSHRGSITGLGRAPQLFRAMDVDQNPITLPARGIILSRALADVLHVEPGQDLTLEIREGAQLTTTVPVSGIADSLLGSPAYMDIDALHHTIASSMRYSGAYLTLIDGLEDGVYSTLKDMPAVAGVSLRRDAQNAFQDIMDQGAGSARFIMGLMAFAITFGIVYNMARVTQDESARDLASLRVMGFRHAEAVFILLGELAAITLIALPIGLGLGTALSHLIAEGFSTDLYQIPVIYAPQAYGGAIAVVTAAALVSGALVQRNIRQTDITLALKTRE